MFCNAREQKDRIVESLHSEIKESNFNSLKLEDFVSRQIQLKVLRKDIYIMFYMFKLINDQKNLNSLYSCFICNCDFPLVSTMKITLKRQERMQKPPKKMKIGPGLLMIFERMGKRVTTIDAITQLTDVVKGIILGSTISGMYAHVIGPKKDPYTNVQMNKPTIERIPWTSLPPPVMYAPSMMNRLANDSPSIPICPAGFLPRWTNMKTEAIPPMKTERLTSEGMILRNPPVMTVPAIFLA